MTETILIAALLGLIAGLGIAWAYSRRLTQGLNRQLQAQQLKQSADNERLLAREEQIAELKRRVQNYEEKIAAYLKTIETDKTRIAELQTSLDNEQKLNKEKLQLLEQAEKNMATAFENLASRIMEEKSKKFTEQNRANLGEVLVPLREQLGDFKKKIEDVYDKEKTDRLSLYNEIKNLKTLNEQMSQDAINLTNALKGDSKQRGNWGEVILERVLQDSGLKNGREYETQGSYRDENNKRLQPDVIVHLPDNKDVIIDSKVSLNAYERYCSSEDDLERQKALKEHLNALRTHVSGLEGKNYNQLPSVNSLDMVLMFVPIEPALMLAMEHDQTLFRDAFKRGIFLVSPSTLTMNLQIIHNMWRYEYQNQNAQEIARQGGDMYDKFVGFVDALEDIGDKLTKAQSSWETAHKRLSQGKGNLVGRAEALKKLGVETKKSLPSELVDEHVDEREASPKVTHVSK